MLKKVYLITKRISQIALYFVEMLGISYLLTIIANKCYPPANAIDFIERITIFYALYQMIILGILQQLNDIKKDEYLAILTMYKYIDLYNTDKNEHLKIMLDNLAKKQLDNSMMNDNVIRQDYLKIKETIESGGEFNPTLVKTKIINYEHCYEEASLNWKYSILLRIFK